MHIPPLFLVCLGCLSLFSAVAPGQTNDQSGSATSLQAGLQSDLGVTYERAGRYTDSEDAFRASIREWTRINGPDAADLVAPLANLGGLYYEAGQLSQAERLISRALGINDVSGGTPETSATLEANLGNVHFAQRKYERAEQDAEEALRRFNRLRDSRAGVARVDSLLGALRLQSGQPSQSESYFTQSLTLWKAVFGQDDPHTAEGLANLAEFYSATGQLAQAEPLFREADAIFRSTGERDSIVSTALDCYADVEEKLGRKKEARRLRKDVKRLQAASAASVMSRDVVDASAFRFAK